MFPLVWFWLSRLSCLVLLGLLRVWGFICGRTCDCGVRVRMRCCGIGLGFVECCFGGFCGWFVGYLINGYCTGVWVLIAWIWGGFDVFGVV